MTNILLINHYASYPEQGMEFRPYYLAKKWVEWGNNVTIAAGTYSHLRLKQPKTGHQNVDGIDYLWLWTNQYQGNGVMRLIGMLIFTLQLILRSVFISLKVRPDVVIASSTYTLDIFPAYLIAKMSRATLVFEIHDLWPLTLIEVGGMSKHHPFCLLMRLGEWFAYKFSDKVVSIIPLAYKHVAKDGVVAENFLHVPNGIHLESMVSRSSISEDLTSLISQAKDDGNLCIGYAGSINAINNLQAVLQAAKDLQDEKVVFFILGPGSDRDNLINMQQEMGLANVVIYQQIPKNTVYDFLQAMDVLYLGGLKGPLFREFGMSSNKLFDYMYVGRPVIEAWDDGGKLVERAACGFSIPADEPLELVKVIKQIQVMNHVDLEKMGQKGKKYVLEHHDYNVLARNFLDFIIAS